MFNSLQAELAARESRVVRMRSDLRPYQSELLIPFLRDNPFSGAFVDMGLGKTISCLTVINDLFERGLSDKVLIIAPLRVAIQTWPTEIAEWEHTWWMNYRLIRGQGQFAELERRRAARSKASIHIINRETLHWLVDFWGRKWPYDTVIVDESRSFADHRSRRWRSLNRARNYIKRMHLLSGVPAPEGIQDYFAQLFLLDRGERLGNSITLFRKKYIYINPWSKRQEPQEGATEKIAQKMADICLVMREEDYLDLAKPIVTERPIILEPDELKRYKLFERNLILKLPGDVEIEAINAAALGQKLMQYASGAVLDEDRKVHHVHSHKLEELKEIREEVPTPLLIAYWHRASLERLRKLFPKATVMDRAGSCVPDWNVGKINELFVHPASAGHGLNMQYGPGHNLVFFDNPWPLELYLQLIKRLARPGQKRVVRVTHLVTRRTLDDIVLPSLRDKDDAQDTVRRYLRDLRVRYQKRTINA